MVQCLRNVHRNDRDNDVRPVVGVHIYTSMVLMLARITAGGGDALCGSNRLDFDTRPIWNVHDGQRGLSTSCMIPAQKLC